MMSIQRETLGQDRLYRKMSEILNNRSTFRLDRHPYLRFQLSLSPSPSSSSSVVSKLQLSVKRICQRRVPVDKTICLKSGVGKMICRQSDYDPSSLLLFLFEFYIYHRNMITLINDLTMTFLSKPFFSCV